MSEADRGTYKAITVSFVADHPMYGQSRHCPGQLPGQGSPVQTAAIRELQNAPRYTPRPPPPQHCCPIAHNSACNQAVLLRLYWQSNGEKMITLTTRDVNYSLCRRSLGSGSGE